MFDNLICTPSQINLLTFPDIKNLPKILRKNKRHKKVQFQRVAYEAFKLQLKYYEIICAQERFETKSIKS